MNGTEKSCEGEGYGRVKSGPGHGTVMTTLQGTQLWLSLSVEAYKMSVDEVLDLVRSDVAAYTRAQAGCRSTSVKKPTKWTRQFDEEWMDTPVEDATVTGDMPATNVVSNLLPPLRLLIMTPPEAWSVNAVNANAQWRHTSQIICFNCGNRDHYSTRCPDPRRNGKGGGKGGKGVGKGEGGKRKSKGKGTPEGKGNSPIWVTPE